MNLKNAIQDIIQYQGFDFLYYEEQVIHELNIRMQDNKSKITDVMIMMNCQSWRILLDAKNASLDEQISAANASIDKLVEQNIDESYAINLVNQVVEGLGFNFSIEDETAAPTNFTSKQKQTSKLRIILFCIIGAALLIGGAIFLRNTLSSSSKDSDADFTWSNHRYYIFLNDTSWEKAQDLCKDKGGHLVTFDTEDEYNTALDYIRNQNDLSKIKFYIGGKRSKSDTKYYWVDSKGNFNGTALNESGHWYSNLWYYNDPSYTDPNSGQEELYMMMYQYDGAWKWFDVPDDVPNLYKEFKGKTGYICEVE